MMHNDLQCIYNTSADMMKHFNSLLGKVRIIVVTTGLTVFASAGTIFLDKNIVWLPLSISILGLLLILSMWFLAHHYIIHTESIAEGARKIENSLFEKTKIDVENGTFHEIHSDHEKWKRIKFAHDYSTFFHSAYRGC
ncbi:MAG: hypothetical protein GY941_09750 [Planctomycetes bacterium]|nr:hypothetical protein [Planctomycetota bacterium]